MLIKWVPEICLPGGGERLGRSLSADGLGLELGGERLELVQVPLQGPETNASGAEGNKCSRRRQRGRERSCEEGKRNGVGRAPEGEGSAGWAPPARGASWRSAEAPSNRPSPRRLHRRCRCRRRRPSPPDYGRVFARGFEGGAFRRGARAVGFLPFRRKRWSVLLKWLLG